MPGVIYQFLLRPDGSSGFPFASEGIRSIFGIGPEELLHDPSPALSRIHPEDFTSWAESVAHSAATLEPWSWVGRIVQPSGEHCWIQATSRPERQSDGSILWDGMLLDVTERKRAEERLRASLKEKEVLLREIHHRVKNNLQIVFSLLYLQARTIRDPRALEAIRESQSRVHAMALVHDTLYRSPALGRVDATEYMKVLVTYLMRAYPGQDGVELHTGIAPVELEIDTAITLGLIVNELVTNSLKHAFRGERGGNEIRITLQPENADSLTLRVSDNGVGLPAPAEGRAPTLGLKLVAMLAEQLGGTSGCEAGPGVEFWVRLPAAQR